MANVKISELPAVTSVTASTAVVPVVDAGTTDKITVADLVKAGLPTQTGNANKALTTNGTTAAWGTVAIAGGGTGATTAAAARTALGVQQMSPVVPTLSASINTAVGIADSVQTSLVYDTFTTQTITGLTWNATKKGFVNTTASVMNLIVAVQSYWATSDQNGLRAEYIRVYSSADVLLYQYAQELDYVTGGTNVPDFNSSCSPVMIPAGAYLVCTVVQTGNATLNNGGMTSIGTPGTTIQAMQLFSGV